MLDVLLDARPDDSVLLWLGGSTAMALNDVDAAVRLFDRSVEAQELSDPTTLAEPEPVTYRVRWIERP